MSLLDTTSFARLGVEAGVCLACLSGALSQAAEEPVVVSSDYLVRTWEVDDGLPDNTVTAVTQTRDGYLWVGTSRGLARFDGVRFSVFTAETTPGLASGNIRCLNEDNDGALWIGFDPDGVARHQAGSFTMMAPVTDSPTNWLTSLAADADRGTWVGLTDLRVMRWRSGQWRHLGAAEGLVGKGAVWCVADAAGKVWFTTETSYGYFDGRRFVVLAADVPFPQLVPRRAGGIWVARASLLQIYNENREFIYGTSTPWRGGGPASQALCEDRQGALWIGTKGQGLFRFDGEFVRVPTSHNFITAIHEDREGNLWVGTWGGGLDRLRPRGLRVHDARSGMPTDVIHAVCQDTEGALWFGARNAGAVRLAGGGYTFFTSTNGWPGGIVTTLCADRAGGVWFGTLLEGLIHWDAGAFRNRGLKGERIESLFQDHQDTLWIGTAQAGLLNWRDGKVSRLPLEDGMREITALAEDSARHLWVGTRTGALYRRDGEHFKRFDRAEGLPGMAIQTILADGPDRLWIGTRGGGLVRFNQGRCSRITTRNGLADDDIRQILPDDTGNLWFGSLRGLFRAARRDLDEVAEGKRATVDCVRYGRSDGLGSFEFSEGYHNAMCRTRDGQLWFASRRGAVEVHPGELAARSEPPPVHIEELLVDDSPRPVPVSGPVVIAPLPRKIELRYTALSLAAPEKVRFRYRLDNLDRAWVEAGAARAATFLRMPPGSHRFHVTACNAEGAWNPAGAALDLTVQPALWQTGWFRIAAVAVLLALVGGGVRLVSLRRMRRRLRLLEHRHSLEQERARIAKDMHDDLGARLTRIAVLSEQARSDPNLPAEAAARAEKISRTAREVSQTLDEIVWTVNPGNDTLERLIGYLGEYAAEYLASTDIRLEQDLPESVPAFPVPSDARHNLLLAVKEALNNAVKHAAAGEIRLRIAVEPGRLSVQLADNGKGFSPEQRQAAGQGLANMRQRLAEAGGDCRVESRPGQGTRVTLALPLRARGEPGETPGR